MVSIHWRMLLETTQFLHVVEQPSHLELVQQLEVDDCSDVGPVCSWTAYLTDCCCEDSSAELLGTEYLLMIQWLAHLHLELHYFIVALPSGIPPLFSPALQY